MIDVHEPHPPEIASEATRGEEYHPTIQRQSAQTKNLTVEPVPCHSTFAARGL